MAPPRKHGRRSTRRRHLVDVSTITAPELEYADSGSGPIEVREPSDDWVVAGHDLSGQGRVAFEIGPDEYEEYRRLQDAEKRSTPGAGAVEDDGADGNQDLPGFLGALGPGVQSDLPTQDQHGQAGDPLFDALREEPDRRGHVRSGHAGGSAALDGLAIPTPSRSMRRRARSVALAASAILAVVAGGYLVLASHSPAGPHTSGLRDAAHASSLADLSSFASTLNAVHQAADHVARVAGDHERIALARARARRAQRHRELQRRERARRQARAGASRTSTQSVAGSSTTNADSQSPAVTTTASSPPVTTSGSSGGSVTGTSSSTTTHTHAFGDGGVLGAGHAG